VTFTSVAGHIQEAEFADRYRKWTSCSPSDLFDAPIEVKVAEVRPMVYKLTAELTFLEQETDCEEYRGPGQICFSSFHLD
jgi:hypothetical protein